MNIPQNLINTVKKSYQSVRVSNIHPTGIFATRALVFIMLVPILLVITQYIMAFISGYVSDEANVLEVYRITLLSNQRLQIEKNLLVLEVYRITLLSNR